MVYLPQSMFFERKKIMSNLINRRRIAEGVYFSNITDSRYKTNLISVCFFSQLDAETVTDMAVVSNLISKSSAEYPEYRALSNKLSRMYSASIYSSVSRMHDLLCVQFSANCLDDIYALSGEKLTDEITDILIGCLTRPVTENGVFTGKYTDLERKTVIDNIKAEINDKHSYSTTQALKTLYEGEPAAVSPNGTIEKAEQITPQSAFDAYKSCLETMRCEIICVGCNDFCATAEKFAKAFGKINRHDLKSCEIKASPLKAKTREVTERMKVNQSKLVLGFKSECDDFRAMDMFRLIYGGTPNSKLFLNVREKLSLCYYCAASYNDLKGSLIAYSGVEFENIEKAREAILDQLETMKRGDFTDEDIDNAVNSLKNDYNAVEDNTSSLARWYFGQIIKNDVITPAEAVQRYTDISRERIIKAARSIKLDTVYVLTGMEEQEA